MPCEVALLPARQQATPDSWPYPHPTPTPSTHLNVLGAVADRLLRTQVQGAVGGQAGGGGVDAVAPAGGHVKAQATHGAAGHKVRRVCVQGRGRAKGREQG